MEVPYKNIYVYFSSQIQMEQHKLSYRTLSLWPTADIIDPNNYTIYNLSQSSLNCFRIPINLVELSEFYILLPDTNYVEGSPLDLIDIFNILKNPIRNNKEDVIKEFKKNNWLVCRHYKVIKDPSQYSITLDLLDEYIVKVHVFPLIDKSCMYIASSVYAETYCHTRSGTVIYLDPERYMEFLKLEDEAIRKKAIEDILKKKRDSVIEKINRMPVDDLIKLESSISSQPNSG
jgi:hypothetical protein